MNPICPKCGGKDFEFLRVFGPSADVDRLATRNEVIERDLAQVSHKFAELESRLADKVHELGAKEKAAFSSLDVSMTKAIEQARKELDKAVESDDEGVLRYIVGEGNERDSSNPRIDAISDSFEARRREIHQQAESQKLGLADQTAALKRKAGAWNVPRDFGENTAATSSWSRAADHVERLLGLPSHRTFSPHL